MVLIEPKLCGVKLRSINILLPKMVSIIEGQLYYLTSGCAWYIINLIFK